MKSEQIDAHLVELFETSIKIYIIYTIMLCIESWKKVNIYNTMDLNLKSMD